MAKKIAEVVDNKVITDNLTLISILTDMESCRKNGITNHSCSIYRDMLNYNVKSDFELSVYHVEIYNTKIGEDNVDERYDVPFDFVATISEA